MALRRVGDRFRHAILFEALGLAIMVPAGTLLFHLPAAHMGIAGVAGATIATVWNFVFNLGFDHALQRRFGHTAKSLRLRVWHALLFEGGLVLILLPPGAWYLGIGLWQAFTMDLAFVLFYVVYAFFFNLAYDRVYPVAGGGLAASTCCSER